MSEIETYQKIVTAVGDCSPAEVKAACEFIIDKMRKEQWERERQSAYNPYQIGSK